MKICHITFSLTNGGVENLLIDVANLQCQQHIVTVFIINDLVEEELLARFDHRITIIRYARRAGSFLGFALIKLTLGLFSQAPDVIHIHISRLIYMVLPFRNKTVCTIHNVRSNQIGIHYNKNLLAISKSVFLDVMNRYHKDSTILYNGIAVDNIREKEGLSLPLKFKIIQVSRLEHKQKGQDILIRGFATFLKEVPGAHLYFAGTGPSELMLKDLVTSLGLNESVTFLGNRERDWVHSSLSEFDLFVQPSRYEGFGLTVAEAMAAGVPVLVSNIDGPMEIIASGLYGSFFDVNDNQDLSRKLIEIIRDYDTPKHLEKTASAKKFARTNFDIKNHVYQLEQYYRKVTKKAG